MAKRISSHQFLTIIRSHGFVFISQSGSHAKYRNPEGRTVIVPHPRKDIPIGTLRSMIRQTDLPKKLFTECDSFTMLLVGEEFDHQVFALSRIKHTGIEVESKQDLWPLIDAAFPASLAPNETQDHEPQARVA